MSVKVCPVCQKTFRTANGHKVCCSPECAHRRRSENMLNRWRDQDTKNICVICKKKFTRTGNAKTCSRRCAIKLRQNYLEKVKNEMSAAAHAFLSSVAKTEQYPACKTWSLRSPAGEVYKFKNLAFFVAKFSELFTHDERKITASGQPLAQVMLGRLRPSNKHPSRSWHGWTWCD